MDRNRSELCGGQSPRASTVFNNYQGLALSPRHTTTDWRIATGNLEADGESNRIVGDNHHRTQNEDVLHTAAARILEKPPVTHAQAYPNHDHSNVNESGYFSEQISFLNKPEFPELNCTIQQYNNVDSRLKTFYNYPVTSPNRRIELAEAGLYYVGVGDKVKCPYCLGKLYNWEDSDVAFEQHATYFSKCPFVLHKKLILLNNTIVSDTDLNDKCFQQNSTSENSVQSSPNPIESGSEKLVTQKPNSVKKFDVEKIVKIVKNLGFDDDNIEKALSVLKSEKKKTFKSSDVIDIIYKIENDEIDFETLGACGGEPKMVDETPVVNAQKCQGNRQFANVSVAYSAGGSNSNDSFHENQENQVPSNFSPMLKSNNVRETVSTKSLNPEPEKIPIQVISKTAHSIPQVSDPKVQLLSQEHKKLKGHSTCNKCKRNKTNILFLPCRHMLVCENCSLEIDDCLKCSKKIIGTVKVFMI